MHYVIIIGPEFSTNAGPYPSKIEAMAAAVIIQKTNPDNECYVIDQEQMDQWIADYADAAIQGHGTVQ